jgi:PhnB protein
MATAINPYLHFKGNAEEAFNFYKSVFGGEFLNLQRYKDAPGMKVSPAEENRLLHVSLPIGKGNVLMASDSAGDMGGWTLHPGNNFSLSINAESKEEADRLHAGLSAGGEVHMPMGDQFWGSYFGMCKDKFGIQWMISFERTPPK